MDRPVELYQNPHCPVPVLQSKWEFEKLLEIYRGLRPARVLEVGSLFGGTLWHWITSLAPRGCAVTVDQLVPKDDPRHGEHLASHNLHWPHWATERGVMLQVIEGDSRAPTNVAQAAHYGPYDFLFIDGDHSYEGVKADFENYSPMIREGGVIAFHDILNSPYWSSIQVPRFWRELQQQGYITQELYSRPDQLFPPDGSAYGIGVVYL